MIGSTPVALERAFLADLAECLHFTKATSRKKKKEAYAAVGYALEFHATRMARVADIPQPAHIRVSIERIVAAAAELANAIDRSKLPHAVVRTLGSDAVRDGTLVLPLTDIRIRGEAAIDQMKRQKSSGMHLKEHAEALSKAEKMFADIFDQFGPKETLVAEDRARWKADFVALCRSRLPAVGAAHAQIAKKSEMKDG